MREVTLRKATAADCDRIASWIGDLAAHEGRPGDATVTGADLERWCLGADRAAEAFIVERDGERVGYAIVCTHFATYQGKPLLYLEDLFVDPSARGAGVGEAAMAALARVAIDRGCAALDWSAVTGNDGAIRFYERLGARTKDGIVQFRLAGADLSQVAGRG
jgi:GNAT superfamily N-acetyltransferase